MEKIEQDWIEVIPVSLLQQWEITEEVQNWIKTYNQQRLEQDQLYKEVVTQDSDAETLIIEEDSTGPYSDLAKVTSNTV